MTDVRKYLRGKTIGVLYGGISAEREVSLKSGASIINALRKEGLRVLPVDVNKNFPETLRKIKIDVAYIALHGPFGEDGVVQAILETAGIPYTGSGVLASALAMNKIFSKKVFSYHKLPTPEWFETGAACRKFPLVVKPAEQGSTIGVSIVKNSKELERGIVKAKKYGEQIIIEKYIPGRELTVGILGNGAGAQALPVIEIVPVLGDYYDFKAKYALGGSKHIIPARIPEKTRKRVQDIAKKAFCALGCRAVARVDFRLTPAGAPYLIEVNTIPGMTETSLLPEAAQKAGLSFIELVLNIIKDSNLN